MLKNTSVSGGKVTSKITEENINEVSDLQFNRNSTVIIKNNTIYSLIMYKNQAEHGKWDIPPGNIYPMSSSKFLLHDNIGFYGSTGELSYTLSVGNQILKTSNKGYFTLKFSDSFTKDNELSYNSNIVDTINGQRVALSLSTVSSKVEWAVHDTMCDAVTPWSTGPIRKDGSPICVRLTLQPNADVTKVYKEFISKAKNRNDQNDPAIKDSHLIGAINNIFQTQRNFIKSNVYDDAKFQGGNGAYNCLAWSLQISDRWIDERNIKDEASAIDFYRTYGFEKDPMCGLHSHVALYCNVKQGRCVEHNGNYGYFMYTHAAANPSSGIDAWSSKFGGMFLLSHNGIDIFKNDSYGQDSICFSRKKGYDVALSLDTIAPLSVEHVDKLSKLVYHIPLETQETFNVLHNEWKTFCFEQPEIVLSSAMGSRAQGDAFDQMVKIGRADPDNILPLLLNKIADPEEFMSVVIYEAITGNTAVHLHSVQEQAIFHVNDWVEAQGSGNNNLIDI